MQIGRYLRWRLLSTTIHMTSLYFRTFILTSRQLIPSVSLYASPLNRRPLDEIMDWTIKGATITD